MGKASASKLKSQIKFKTYNRSIKKKNPFGKETVKLEAVANNNLIIISVIAIKDGKETQGWVVLFDFIFTDVIQI